MPYLEYLFCEHCGPGAQLDIDFVETIQAYNGDGRLDTSINQSTFVWDYLIYSCGICGKRHLYTYKDVERRVREYLSSISKEHKEYFDARIGQMEKRKVAVGELQERIQRRYKYR